VISYCIAVYRPTYARLLLADLVAKTSVTFEILVWLNVADATLDREIDRVFATSKEIRLAKRLRRAIRSKLRWTPHKSPHTSESAHNSGTANY
jgi:hypothetical protein